MKIKNKICILIAAIILITVFPSASLAAGNLIKNGDFEKNADNWTGTRASIEYCKTDAHLNSAGCIKVQTVSAYGMAAQRVALEKNVSYQVTAWVKLEKGTASVSAQMIMGHGGSEYGYLAAGTRVTDEWTKLSAVYKYTGVNKTGAAQFFLQLDYNNGCPPITYYMDDVSVIPIGNSGPVYRETETAENETAVNTGFDDDANGYTLNNARIYVTEGEGYDNSRYCARVSPTGNFGTVGQNLKLEKGRNYILSAAVKMDKGQSEFMYAISYDGHTEYIQTGEMIYDNWKKIEVDYLYTGNDGDVNISLCTGKSKSVFYLDDFSVKSGEKREITENNQTLPENTDGKCRAAVNNKIIKFTVAPYINNDYMMVQLSGLSETLNLRYEVNGGKISIAKGKKKCSAEIGSAFVSDKDGTAYYTESPVMKHGHVMIPIGAVLKCLGIDYSYDSSSKTVLITAGEPVYYLSALAEKTGDITVGYIGGEVTNGEYLTDKEKYSWRAKTTEWLKEYFDECQVTEINASRSYTDSVLASYRVENDLLKYDPDIVFIEFAPDDENNDVAAESMEALIRKIKIHNSDTVIVAVNTASQNMLEEYIKLETPSVTEKYSRVFDYYNILSINAGKALAEKAGSADKIKSYIPHDSIANSSAQSIYAGAVTDALKNALDNAGKYTPSAMKKALSGKYENGNLITADKLNGNGFEKNAEYLYGSEPGAEIKYTFTGKSIGIYWQSGPDTGDIEYSIDGGDFKTATTFNEMSSRLYTYDYKILEDNMSEKEHTLILKIKNTKNAASSGYNIRIYGLLVN